MPLHPQVVASLARVAALGLAPVTDCTPDEARANDRRRRAELAFTREPVATVRDTSVPGPAGELAVRIHDPGVTRPAPLVLLLHGGGWVVGDLDSEDTTARGLARRAGAIVVSVDYRLAPEAPFPAGLDDAEAALDQVLADAQRLGIDPTRVALAGTSAGANLCAALALRLRERGGAQPVHQVLLCPVADADLTRPSFIDYAGGHGLTRDAMAWYWDHYIADPAGRHHPHASVLRADLTGVAPATVVTAECDPLRDEGEALAAALADAGVDVVARRFDGMHHGFNVQVGVIDAALDALDLAGGRLAAAFSSAA